MVCHQPSVHNQSANRGTCASPHAHVNRDVPGSRTPFPAATSLLILITHRGQKVRRRVHGSTHTNGYCAHPRPKKRHLIKSLDVAIHYNLWEEHKPATYWFVSSVVKNEIRNYCNLCVYWKQVILFCSDAANGWNYPGERMQDSSFFHAKNSETCA